jgi:hypothetical protein
MGRRRKGGSKMKKVISRERVSEDERKRARER